MLIQILIFLTAFVTAAGGSEALLDLAVEPEFGDILQAEPSLLHDGGAKVVESHGKRYFIAVGVTLVKPDSPQERLRQIRVGRIQAIKAAAEFIQATQIKAQEKLTQDSTVTRVDGKKSGTSMDVFEESTVTQIEALLRVPPQIGSWKSADGELFFYAIGAQLQQ
jgi:hypothetical protein